MIDMIWLQMAGNMIITWHNESCVNIIQCIVSIVMYITRHLYSPVRQDC
jgi:hypothetical protein